MLTALANAMRAGARFEVTTAALAEPAALAPLAANADVVALFYGSKQSPLPEAVRALAPELRARGGRLIAVLQKEQAGVRDDCFRAGASDALFMPMPKEAFVARLFEAASLAFSAASGREAAVSAAAHGQTFALSLARVHSAGLQAGSLPALKPGDTARLSWGDAPAFARWGLVAQSSADGLRIRWAGSTPEEDSALRSWLAGTPLPFAPAAPAPVATVFEMAPAGAAVAAAPDTVLDVKTVVDSPAVPPTVVNAPSVAATQIDLRPPSQIAPTQVEAPAAVAPGARSSAPGVAQDGLPPGFAARPPVRPQSRVGQITNPGRPRALDGSQGGAASGAGAEVLAAPASAAPAEVGLDSLFDEPLDPSGSSDALANLPGWPARFDSALARTLLTRMLREKELPDDAPAGPSAAVRNVLASLPSAERDAVDLSGVGSALYDALAARVLLAAASSEGGQLRAEGQGALVDEDEVGSLGQLAGAAARRLQTEADRAISGGQLEALQQIRAASAALSRELLAFQDAADRLRGLAAAPKRGTGALDPQLLVGAGSRPSSPRREVDARAEPVRAGLSDFAGLQDVPAHSSRKRALWLASGLLAVAAIYAFGFALPRTRAGTASLLEQAGTGVLGVTLSERSAIVSVTSAWVTAPDRRARAAKVCAALAPKGIQSAALFLEGKGMVGQLEIASCETSGLPAQKPPEEKVAAPEKTAPAPVPAAAPAQSKPRAR